MVWPSRTELVLVAGIVGCGAGMAALTLQRGVAARDVSLDRAFLSAAKDAGYSVGVESAFPFDKLALRCTRGPADACGPVPAIETSNRPDIVMK